MIFNNTCYQGERNSIFRYNQQRSIFARVLGIRGFSTYELVIKGGRGGWKSKWIFGLRVRTRRGCRSIAVTGKRGHRVYASGDDIVEEPRMSQFRAAGVVAPDYRQPVHRVRWRLCTSNEEERKRKRRRRKRGVGLSISRSRAHPGIALVIVSPFNTWIDRN